MLSISIFSDEETKVERDLPKVTQLLCWGKEVEFESWSFLFQSSHLSHSNTLAPHRCSVWWSRLGRTEVTWYFILSFGSLKGADAFTEGNEESLSLIFTQSSLWLSLLYIISCPPCAHILGFERQSLLAVWTHLTLLLWFTHLCLPHMTLQFAVSPWRRQWHPTPVLLPGKYHGWRSLVGCSPWGCWELDMTQWLHFHFSLSCTGEGNGNQLQCSCLENPRDGGAWWAAVCEVAQSWTRLKQLSCSSSSMANNFANTLWI